MLTLKPTREMWLNNSSSLLLNVLFPVVLEECLSESQ